MSCDPLLHEVGQFTATGPARRPALCTVQYANTGEERGVSALETLLRTCVCVCVMSSRPKLLVVVRVQFSGLLFDFLSAEHQISSLI